MFLANSHCCQQDVHKKHFFGQLTITTEQQIVKKFWEESE
jgi:hypothetical protein